jgi:hypothetical protein
LPSRPEKELSEKITLGPRALPESQPTCSTRSAASNRRRGYVRAIRLSSRINARDDAISFEYGQTDQKEAAKFAKRSFRYK